LLYQSINGGIVVWRPGSSTVLYRGMTYKPTLCRIVHKNIWC